MRAYIIAVIFIATLHCISTVSKFESPLSWQFFLLIASPILILAWKDLAKLKLDPKGGLELERLKEEINKSIVEISHGRSVDSKSIDKLFKSTELNDWLTLVLARMLMRKALVFLNRNHELGPSPSLKKLIQSSLENGKLTQEECDNLERLRNITFYAEWWGGDAPTFADWDWALKNSKNIVQKLFGKLSIAPSL
jgi:hypothetical protein